MKEFEFIKGFPALHLESYSAIVIGDLHIGKELKLAQSGIRFLNVTQIMANTVLKLCRSKKAKKLILLGDIKESILYPDKEEYNALGNFFNTLKDLEIMIAKGNHDSHMEEILKVLNVDATVDKEITLGNVVLMHGNALPSENAMMEKLIVMAHSHAVLEKNNNERIWIKASIGTEFKEYYDEVNKKEELIITPQFNDILSGMDITKVKEFIPVLRNNIFEFKKIKVYGLDGKIRYFKI